MVRQTGKPEPHHPHGFHARWEGGPVEAVAMVSLGKWLWLKIKEERLRGFWSMFPLTRVPFWNSGFLSHSQMANNVLPRPSPIMFN